MGTRLNLCRYFLWSLVKQLSQEPIYRDNLLAMVMAVTPKSQALDPSREPHLPAMEASLASTPSSLGRCGLWVCQAGCHPSQGAIPCSRCRISAQGTTVGEEATWNHASASSESQGGSSLAASRRNCMLAEDRERQNSRKKKLRATASNGSFVTRLRTPGDTCYNKNTYICIHTSLAPGHSFNKSLLSTYSVPSTALGAKNSTREV